MEEGLYGSAAGPERRAPVLQRMTLVVSALAPSVYATLRPECACVRERACTRS